MPYNQQLAERLREKLLPLIPVTEKKMFGGVAFLLNGNMTVGVIRETLIVRVGPEKHKAALAMPGARPFDMTGRPMNGWVMVSAEGFSSGQALENWIHLALEFAQTLPPK